MAAPMVNLQEVFGVSGLPELGVTNLQELMKLSRVKDYLTDNAYFKLIGAPGRTSYIEDEVYNRLTSIGKNAGQVYDGIQKLCKPEVADPLSALVKNEATYGSAMYNRLNVNLKQVATLYENVTTLKRMWDGNLAGCISTLSNNFRPTGDALIEISQAIDKLTNATKGGTGSVCDAINKVSSWSSGTRTYLSNLHSKIFGSGGFKSIITTLVSDMSGKFEDLRVGLYNIKDLSDSAPLGKIRNATKTLYTDWRPTYADSLSNFRSYYNYAGTRDVDLMFKNLCLFGKGVCDGIANLKKAASNDVSGLMTHIETNLFLTTGKGLRYVLAESTTGFSRDDMFLTKATNAMGDAVSCICSVRDYFTNLKDTGISITYDYWTNPGAGYSGTKTEIFKPFRYIESWAGALAWRVANILYGKMQVSWTEVAVTHNTYTARGNGIAELTADFLARIYDLYLDDFDNALQDAINCGVALKVYLDYLVNQVIRPIGEMAGMSALLMNRLICSDSSYKLDNLAGYFNTLASKIGTFNTNLTNMRDRLYLFTIAPSTYALPDFTTTNLNAYTAPSVDKLEEFGFRMASLYNLFAGQFVTLYNEIGTLAGGNYLYKAMSAADGLKSVSNTCKSSLDALLMDFNAPAVPDFAGVVTAINNKLDYGSLVSSVSGKAGALKFVSLGELKLLGV